jgi:hypothetical protein
MATALFAKGVENFSNILRPGRGNVRAITTKQTLKYTEPVQLAATEGISFLTRNIYKNPS